MPWFILIAAAFYNRMFSFSVYFGMKTLNIADWISIYRIVAVPAILGAIFFNQRELTGWLLLISFFTDALDGFIARKFNITSDRGANLDSVGDALTFVAGVVGVVVFGKDYIIEHLWIIVIALALYFVQLGLAVLRYGRSSSFHTYSAKTAAVFQAIFLTLFHLIGWIDWLFWIGIAISIFETIEEIILIGILKEWKTDVKGLYWVLKDKK